MQNKILAFNEKIRLLLQERLQKSGLTIASLAKQIGESEEHTQFCFENAMKCQPRILFKASKALGVESEVMMLMTI